MNLSAEQHRALTFLTTAALNGATQSGRAPTSER
jgi:hypothetical protein